MHTHDNVGQQVGRQAGRQRVRQAGQKDPPQIYPLKGLMDWLTLWCGQVILLWCAYEPIVTLATKFFSGHGGLHKPATFWCGEVTLWCGYENLIGNMTNFCEDFVGLHKLAYALMWSIILWCGYEIFDVGNHNTYDRTARIIIPKHKLAHQVMS